MKIRPPTPPLTVPISHETYHQLLMASGQTFFEKEDWEIAAIAIREWMTRNTPDVFKLAPTAGYQWKSVFLPNAIRRN